MPAITRDSLLTLEAYARERDAFRARAIAHKRLRSVAIADHVSLLFEDELTVRYQIQEMLRIEKIFEEKGIQHELDAYNPLVPDGRDFRATMMIEFPDVAQRIEMLQVLRGIERTVWLAPAGVPKIFGVADEDLERENAYKTASVHFLRFPLSDLAIAELRAGRPLSIGIDHPQFMAEVMVADATRKALLADLT